MRVRLAAAVAAASLVCGAGAHADVYTPGLYTVLGYAGALPNFKSVANVSTPSYLDGIEADIGWRFNRFYSIEASYDYDTGSKTFGGEHFDSSLQSATIDALGYLPFGWNSPWALFGEVGGGAYFSSSQAPLVVHGDETRFGGQAGGGLQYQFDRNLGVRVSGRYEWTGVTELKSAEVITVGLVWQR